MIEVVSCQRCSKVFTRSWEQLALLCPSCLSELGTFTKTQKQPNTSCPQPSGDPVNHPKHYNSHPSHCECGKRIECIQIAEHMGFCLGNAAKYIWRADHKNGIEDLEKAVWYLKREIEKRKKEKNG